jgi:hypothetical protein
VNFEPQPSETLHILRVGFESDVREMKTERGFERQILALDL